MSPRILWHRRFGHAQSPRLDKTSDYVAGLPRTRPPAYCECCIRAKLRKKNASRDPAARPHASQPLGEVSAYIIEFRVRDNECVSTVDNHRFAVVFVDGFSRYKHAYMMHTKDEALDAIKDFVRQVGKPRRLLTDKDSVFIRGAVQRYCLDNGIAQVQ